MHNIGKSLWLALIMLTFFSLTIRAQFTEKERSTLVASIEQLVPKYKVAVCYLQPNKGIYETGEDLWFKAYLLDAQNLLPFKADTTLYVQVVPITGGKAVLQEKILLLNGFGSGHLYVSDSLPEGDYYLQAFSAHSYAGQTEFKDQRKITIKKSIIPAVKVDYTFNKEVFATADSIGLQITLKTRTGARIASADVNAALQRNGYTIESIKTTMDRLGNARLVFKPVDTISGTTVAITTSGKEISNEQLFTISVPYKIQHLHFYSFPEGGYLVRGLLNVLAFKATDETGVPVEVKGSLLEDDQPVLSLATVHDGMGKLSFVPQKNKQYKIRLEAPYSDSNYQLQNIRDEGLTLSFTGRTSKGYAFRVAKNSAISSPIFLRAQVRGKVYSLAKATLKDSVTIVLPPNDFPQGIAEVTLFNASMNPVAERLVYINPEKRLHIEVDSVNPSIRLRQRQQLKIKVTDEDGNPVVAHLGVSVYDTLYRNNSDAKNIFTHYYIDNGLKGNVYKPAWYFNEKNTGRYEALDLLLMTHGWRRYVWSEKNMKDFHPKQIIANNIKGSIAVYQRKKKLPGPFFTFFFAPDNKEYKNFIEPDSAGSFTIRPYDLASADNGYIYAKVTPPEGTNVNIKINNPFDTISQLLRTLSLTYPKTFHWPKKQEEPGHSMMDRALLLDAVVVKARNSWQFRDKYIGYLDSLTKADMTTDYIEVRDADSATYRTSNKVFTMNNPITKPEWRRKPIEGKTYSILYYKGSPITASNWKGGAIIFDHWKDIIYHYPKFTEEELLKKYNLGRVKGYNISREFFNPDYENSQNIEGSTDYRNALYWKPDVITNESGEAVIKFFSSDISSGFIGIIEGVDGNGLLGNYTFEFKVTGK